MAKITLYRDGRTIQVESTEYARVSRLYRDGWSRTATSRSSRGGRSGRASMPSISGSPFDAAVSEMQGLGVSPLGSTYGAFSGANDAPDRLGGTRRETYVDAGWFAMRALPVIGPFAGHIRDRAEREKGPHELDDEDAMDRVNAAITRAYGDREDEWWVAQGSDPDVLGKALDVFGRTDWSLLTRERFNETTGHREMVFKDDHTEQEMITRLMNSGMSEREAIAALQTQMMRGGFVAGGMYAFDLADSATRPFDPGDQGGGGGGGSRMPAYIPPDRRTIEEMTRNSMVSLLGKIDDSNLDNVVDGYMRDHRRNWEGESIDPNMTMLEEIRNSEDYKKIHQLRPDSANEATWVSNQRQAFIQGGGRETAAEDRSRELAAVGATASTRSAGASEFQEGFETGGFMQRFQRSAQSIAARMN